MFSSTRCTHHHRDVHSHISVCIKTTTRGWNRRRAFVHNRSRSRVPAESKTARKNTHMRKRKRERERERQIETSSRRLQIFSARNVTRILLVRVRRQHSNTWVVLLPKPKSLRRCFFLPLRFLSRVGGVVCPCFVYLYSLREETKENVCRFVVTFPP